ncbi:MAG: sialate O-acetylesterase [Prochlorothrix sp.]|nr:sialate O-acetylesterase [Prochlorothrix sp.]
MDQSLIGLILGQSNAANYGETRHRSRPGVWSFHNGTLIPAADPLPGADGDGGSVWTRLGDRLLASGFYNRVIWVPLARGGSAIAQWVPGGDLYDRIPPTIAQLHQANLGPTHVLWHQGEADAYTWNTPPALYQQRFRQLVQALRAMGITAPIYLCLATRFQELDRHEPLRRAQRELTQDPGVYRGPDTDMLGSDYRYDGAHFSTAGLDRFADLWLEVLLPETTSLP